jgi:C-terminal processing protease CtpA/Prc
MPDHTVAGSLVPFDSKFPRFNPPPGFRLRLGSRSTDEFVTGTFPVGTRTVGFIRIPSFQPASQTNALTQFRNEILFLQQNTSGLVIDLLGNGGGSLCYTNALVQYLSPQPFQTVPVKLRATQQWLVILENLLVALEFNGGSHADIDIANGWIHQTQAASEQNRGDTDPIYLYSPLLCSGAGGLVYSPATLNGNNIAYTKPILLLTDNFTISAAEFFSAILQDIHRVSVYGMRTDGGGGNVVGYNFATGAYAEGNIRMTQSLAVRNHDITTPGLPSAPYIENIGIQPDFFADYQTKTNLLTGGQPFVGGFVNTIGSLMGH